MIFKSSELGSLFLTHHEGPRLVAHGFKIWDSIKIFSCLVTQSFGNSLRKKIQFNKASFSTKRCPDLAFLQKTFRIKCLRVFISLKDPCGISSRGGGEGTPRSCFFTRRPHRFLSYLKESTVFQ